MKELFQKYNVIGYDVTGSGEKRSAIDILQRTIFRQILLNNFLIFYPYMVKDHDTPEIIAAKLYGNPQYHWIVMYANNIVDPYYDWPLSYDNFNATIRKRYTTPARDGVEFALSTPHHYEDLYGAVIDEVTYLSLPVAERNVVSIYDWEYNMNEAKRSIRLLDSNFVSQVDAQMDQFMQQATI